MKFYMFTLLNGRNIAYPLADIFCVIELKDGSGMVELKSFESDGVTRSWFNVVSYEATIRELSEIE